MGRILLVEDNAHVRREIARLLQGLGHEVMAVDSVDGAIQMLDAIAIDLVFTDYQLGSSDGLVLARAIRTEWPWIPTLLMSGSLDETLERQAVDLGVLACLAKPFGLPTLRQAVEGALETHPGQA